MSFRDSRGVHRQSQNQSLGANPSEEGGLPMNELASGTSTVVNPPTEWNNPETQQLWIPPQFLSLVKKRLKSESGLCSLCSSVYKSEYFQKKSPVQLAPLILQLTGSSFSLEVLIFSLPPKELSQLLLLL